jgi:S1-C subfamily serine protease
MVSPWWRPALAAGALALMSRPSLAVPPVDFVPIVNRVSPAVANIDVVRHVRRRMPGWFSDGRSGSAVQRGVGSGFVISPDGLVVTNAHVVEGKPELTVTLWSGRSYRGRVIGTDPLTDVALVRIPAHHLAVLPLGNSDSVQAGEWVLAFGSPLGLRRTVTSGIVSSTNREVEVNERIGFLQTDAAINPGNSGGPLVDMQGRAIGINTAIAAEAQGIGFAIPINALKLVLHDLETRGRVIRPWLGISFATITPELSAEYPELAGRRGLVVAEVVPGGPADRAGLMVEDVIVALNGQPMATSRDLIAAMARHHPGERVALTVLRGRRRLQVPVTLQTMPATLRPPAEP